MSIPSRAQTTCDVTYSGVTTVPAFTIPAGQKHCFNPNQSTTLSVTGNLIVNGTLEMLPSSATVVHTLKFIGANENEFVGGNPDPDAPLSPVSIPATDDGLWVIGGTLNVQGAQKTAWAKASGSLTAGETSITLSSIPSGWRNGDIIVVVPTDLVREYHVPPATNGTEPDSLYEPTDWQRYDQATIASQSGATINLSSPLQFSHPAVTFGGTPKTAEILNLTRNVRIEGMPPSVEYPRTVPSPNNPGRSHILIQSDQAQTIKYAALRYMGPRKFDSNSGHSEAIIGRYALHFHASAPDVGSEVEGVVARLSGSHSFVPHATDGVEFSWTIAHDVSDHAYWWDNPARSCAGGQSCGPDHQNCSDGTNIHHSVASLVKADPWSDEQTRVTGFAAACGLDNSITDSVAVGVQGTVDASGFAWLEGVLQSPWAFARNTAHNNKRQGIFWWQVDCVGHVVDEFDSYRNGGNGIEHGAYTNNVTYDDVRSYQDGADDQDNNDDAAFWLVAGDHQCEGNDLAMEDFTIDGGGVVDNTGTPYGRAVIIDRKTVGHFMNTHLRRFTVSGYPISQAFLINEPDTWPHDDYFEIDAECWTRNGNDISGSDWEVTAIDQDSVLRVQRTDQTAFQIDAAHPTGNLSILNFASCPST
jgi:hypothetical protein